MMKGILMTLRGWKVKSEAMNIFCNELPVMTRALMSLLPKKNCITSVNEKASTSHWASIASKIDGKTIPLSVKAKYQKL